MKVTKHAAATGLAILQLLGSLEFFGVALAHDTAENHSHKSSPSPSSASTSAPGSSSAASASASSSSLDSGLVTSSKLQIHVSNCLLLINCRMLVLLLVVGVAVTPLQPTCHRYSVTSLIIIQSHSTMINTPLPVPLLPHQTRRIRTSRGPLRHTPLRRLHCPTNVLCRRYCLQF